MNIENYFNVLERLKESVDKFNPIFLQGSQYEEIRKTCSEDEIVDFYKLLENYVTSKGMSFDIENRYILTYSEYPLNPMLTELYRINLNFLNELEKPILMLIEDSSNIPESVLKNAIQESDIVEFCQNTISSDSKEVLEFSKEIPIYKQTFYPNSVNVEENAIKTNTKDIDDFSNIVRELEIIMKNTDKNYLFIEDLYEVFSELPYKLSEFHNISQKICKSLEKTNRLYYNGFITRKGYFLNLSNSEEFIGIPLCKSKEKLVIYLFTKKELSKYNNILPVVSNTIKYLDELEIRSILKERERK